MAAPAGNTTMAPDEGKRLTPEEVAKLAKNLSQDAELIANTFERPPYTPEAEDAGLEGRFVVDVYVNEEGLVTSAELRKPIGFGMDQRVLESAKKSRFRPRRDAKGQPVAGWTEIKVRLTID
jgi:TonB family protein